MSSPNPVIEKTTAPVTRQLQGQEADQIVLYVTGTYGVAETVQVMLPTTDGNLVAYNDVTTVAPLVLGSGGVNEALVPGGILYTLVKTATAAPAGVDCQFKPRQGF